MVKYSGDDIDPSVGRVEYVADNAEVSQSVVNSFIKNLPKYQGRDVKEGLAAGIDTALQKIASLIGGAGRAVLNTANTIPIVLGILAIGIAAYLIFAGRKGTKLTPF
jgi:hypothetical protein